jgi:hypothetical protein
MKISIRIANKLTGGNERRFTGRSQLWSTTARRAPSASQINLIASSLSKTTLTPGFSKESLTSQAPVIPPMSFSEDSINLPGLTRASTVASRSSIASVYSVLSKSPTSRTSSVVTLPAKNPGDLGIVLDTPFPPRLVMLLRDESGSQSMIVIDGRNCSVCFLAHSNANDRLTHSGSPDKNKP